MVINQKLRYEKLNNVDQSNAKSQMLKVKCNSHISFCKIMGTEESQQKIFNYQELKIDFNMCKIFDKLI